jgi:orotidine-5'-phosphate decarboxylase
VTRLRIMSDRLIVALDGDAPGMGIVFARLYRETPIRWFKIGPAILLDHSGMILIENMMRETGVNLFLDLKLYDTRDTVDRTVRRAFDLGARFVTVHATPSMVEAAMRAKPPGDRCKVLAIKHLTDQPPPWDQEDLRGTALWFEPADGLVLPSWAIKHVHKDDRADKVIVCPGIRRAGKPESGGYRNPDDPNNHARPATPTEALRAGADYLVVGRPITAAPDPIAAAKAIIQEMNDVQ